MIKNAVIFFLISISIFGWINVFCLDHENKIYKRDNNELTDNIFKICKDNRILDSLNKIKVIDTVYQYFQVYHPTIPKHIDSCNNFVHSHITVFYWGKFTDTIRFKYYKNFCDL